MQTAGFKNCVDGSIPLHSGFNCFSGLNGAGKTNILDAVYLLCMTKSYFSIKDDDLISWGGEFYRVVGDFRSSDEEHKVVIKYPRGERKVIELDGDTVKRYSDHIGFCPLVMIAPGEEAKWLAISAERRKWIDVTLSQSSRKYLEALIAYNRLLRQRNACLKSEQSTSSKTALLPVYDEKMEPHQKLITQIRVDYIRTILPVFQRLYRVISRGSELAGLRYEPNLESEPEQAWMESRNYDLVSGRTNKGCHKDDVAILVDDQDARHFASQGQKKSLLLAARLAQYDYLQDILGEKPLLLLDDIFDKLDPTRVGALIDLISSDQFGQVLLTDTEPERLSRIFEERKMAYYHYLVEDGKCTRI